MKILELLLKIVYFIIGACVVGLIVLMCVMLAHRAGLI